MKYPIYYDPAKAELTNEAAEGRPRFDDEAALKVFIRYLLYDADFLSKKLSFEFEPQDIFIDGTCLNNNGLAKARAEYIKQLMAREWFGTDIAAANKEE